MRSKCVIQVLFTVLCLATEIAQSDTAIEVDENGNEYEVKRFNIGGRKLNGGRPHCVITRRKRSPVVGLSGYGSGNDNDEAENSFIGTNYMSNIPSVSPILTLVDDNGYDKDDHKEQEVENNFDQQNVDPLPVDSQPAAITSNHTNSNDIVLIQFNTPPKVDPLTHAVFELRPVYPYEKGTEIEYAMGHPTNEGENQTYDDDKKPYPNILNTRRPQRHKPNTFNPTRNPGQLGNNETKQKKKCNKEQTITKHKVQNNSLPKRRNTDNYNMNRLPDKSQTGNKNMHSRRPTISPNASNMRRKKNQNKKNSENKILGNTVIKEIVTITTTRFADGDSDVNCIFIEKAPTVRRTRAKTRKTTTTTTTTTRRPFWRILGRTAGVTPDNGYGMRKRIKLGFVV